MQKIVSRFVVCCLVVNDIAFTISEECTKSKSNILYINSQKTGEKRKSIQNILQHPHLDHSMECPRTDTTNRSLKEKTKIIHMIEIDLKEPNQYPSSNIFSKNSENLFFIESSGRNYLRPRDACAIESAVKNSGIAGKFIIVMTSRNLNILANNATCQIYTQYAERVVFFRYVNVDTIFRGTPFQELHVNGHLKYYNAKNTIVQYR